MDFELLSHHGMFRTCLMLLVGRSMYVLYCEGGVGNDYWNRPRASPAGYRHNPVIHQFDWIDWIVQLPFYLDDDLPCL